MKLKNICQINPKSSVLPDSFIYIDLESVSDGILLKESRINKFEAPSRAQRLLKREDILFQMVRPYQMNNLFFDKKGDYVASTGYAQLRTKEHPKFIFQYLHYQRFVNKVVKRCTGTSYPAINSTDLANIKIAVPSKNEQTKISNLLSLLDKRVKTQNEIIDNLETLKSGLLQKIFKQKIRFKNEKGNYYSNWKLRRISDVLFEHKLKSSGNEEVHSVSVHKGVINQIEHLGRSFSAKNTDHYSRVLPNDIIYTKSPTGDFPFGIIKQSHIKKEVIVSPLYGVFTPETKELGYILHVYFESKINTSNYLSSIIQKGAKNTINISNTTFLSKKLWLPVSKYEQMKIANLIYLIDRKIKKENRLLDQYQSQKKYLLQNLFI